MLGCSTGSPENRYNMCPSSQQVSAFLSCPTFGRGHLFCLHNSFRWTPQCRCSGTESTENKGLFCLAALVLVQVEVEGRGQRVLQPRDTLALAQRVKKINNHAILCLKVKSYYDLKGLGTHLYLHWHWHAVDTRDTHIYCSRRMCNDSRSIEFWFARIQRQ